jgi:hypothetical protein
VTRWKDPSFIAGTAGWARQQLAALDRDPRFEVEQPHVYPWGTVLRLRGPEGSFWLKASTPAVAHEGNVIAELASRRPDLVPEVLARDAARGLMLQADAGTRLRDLLDGEPGLDHWLALLPQYAGLQLALAPDRDALVAAGAPDRGAAQLPLHFAALLEEEAPGDAALRALVPRVREAAARLAEVGVPETIQHDDLHDGQVFLRDGRYRFLDWGDACVSHPFLTLVVTERALRHRGLGDDGIARARDAYLEPFTVHAPRAALDACLPDVVLLGSVNRALTWARILGDAHGEPRAEYADAVPGWLALVLDAAA